MTQTTLYRSCPTCEASCGLALEVDREAKKIISIKGDPDDHRSRGYVCAKSQAFRYVYEDGERLRKPVRRNGDRWEEISWEEALNLAAEKLSGIKSQYGKDSIAMYIGNPLGHDVGAQLYFQPLHAMFDTQRFFSGGTVDQQPKNMSCAAMFGDVWFIPVPDLDHTDFFICMGGNPLVSQGSLMSAPNAELRFEQLRERGGKLVVIDPRRTETAAIADSHIFIRPGSDAFFLLAFVNVLFAEERVQLGRLEAFTDGVDEVRELAKRYTPENTAAITGVDAAVTRQLVADFCAAEKPVLYGRLGLCTQRYGTLASWLVDVVNVLTGRLDAEGGSMFARPATGNFERWMPTMPFPRDRWKSRVRGFPECYGQLPASLMAEEITAPGEDKVRALITLAGNPVLTVPNGEALREALDTVDFMVAIDLYINETTSKADLILPPSVQLENSNYDMLFQGTSVRNFCRYIPQTFEAEPGSLQQWRVILELTARSHGMKGDDLDNMMLDGMIDMALANNPRLQHLDKATIRSKLSDEHGWERQIDFMLRAGPYGDAFAEDGEGLSLAEVKKHPHGLDLGPLQPRLPEMLRTEDQRIKLMHPMIREDMLRLDSELDAPAAQNGKMLLIGRRHIRDMNSWLHNIHQYTRGKNRCTLLVNPDDAERIGLRNGGPAKLRSSQTQNEIVAEVEISDQMMPGVVSLPHGFGHIYDDSKQSNASTAAGVSCNFVIDADALDLPSGTSVVNGAPIEVLPVSA